MTALIDHAVVDGGQPARIQRAAGRLSGTWSSPSGRRTRAILSAALLLGAVVAGVWLLATERSCTLQPLLTACATLAGLALHPWPRRGLIATVLISLSWGELGLYVGACIVGIYALWVLLPRGGMSGPRDGSALLAEAPLPAWALALIIAIAVGIRHIAEFGITVGWRL